MKLLRCWLLLLCLSGIAYAAPAEATYQHLDDPVQRLAAQQELFDYARTFRSASAESKAFFERLKRVAAANENPEVKSALAQVLLLDPAGKPVSPMSTKLVQAYPVPEGTTPATKLAELERDLDLGAPPAGYVLTPEELVVLAQSENFPLAQRANRLLRRINAKLAAPILWERLVKLTQRSQIQEVEDEILRLPPTVTAKFCPLAAPEGGPAAKAAWLRIIAVRSNPRLTGNVRLELCAFVLPLLKGPANELTEAAWAATPNIFRPADRAELEAAAVGLPERLALRAKAALEVLPAR